VVLMALQSASVSTEPPSCIEWENSASTQSCFP